MSVKIRRVKNLELGNIVGINIFRNGGPSMRYDNGKRLWYYVLNITILGSGLSVLVQL